MHGGKDSLLSYNTVKEELKWAAIRGLMFYSLR